MTQDVQGFVSVVRSSPRERITGMTLLNRPALVLNKNWQAVNVTSVQRALLMLCNDAARVVDPEDFQLYDWEEWASLVPRSNEPAIRGVSLRLRVPEVVTLTRYDRVPTATVSLTKRNIFKRDRFTCQYCGIQPGKDELTIDHIVPRSRGGVTSWENCVLACGPCNRRKGDRSPENVGLKLRSAPKQPAWKPLYSMATAHRESWMKFIREWD
ncbi:MAG TPA: HNH endonuclease [Pirellulaceae bacterium]|nr:HNH endonuclease [Pirellulaceae bacterium]